MQGGYVRWLREVVYAKWCMRGGVREVGSSHLVKFFTP